MFGAELERGHVRDMKTVMFMANNYTALSGMVFLINQMKRKYQFIPVMICEFCYHESEEYQVINVSGKCEKPMGNLEKPPKDFYNIKQKKIRKQIRQFVHYSKEMLRYNKMSRKILEDIQPDAFVIGCDRMGGILQGFLKNIQKIPIIRVPVGATCDYNKGFFQRYYNCELILSNRFWDLNRLQLLINKYWVKEVNGEYRTFYPLGYTMAGWVNHMISMHPWVSGGGKATHVLAMSDDERERILEEVDKPVVVTGLLEDSYILSQDREKVSSFLKAKYNVREKVVVLAMPQLAEHSMTTWDIHKANMRVLIQLLNEIFGKILISLHPKSDIENYKYLLEYGICSFLDERLRDAICGADILVAVSSSTVLRWAELLQIGKVVLDVKYLQEKIEEKQLEEIKEQIFLDLLSNKKQDEGKNSNIKCAEDLIISIIEGGVLQ